MKFDLMWILVTLVLRVWIVSGETKTEPPVGAVSLAFVFDITGSMHDDLEQVIEGADNILAATVRGKKTPLHNFVLVPFHDPVVGPVLATTDYSDFQHELKNLYVQGGGDCPEMSITAIKKAVDVSLPNSFIYVFTDARSKDYNLTEEVLAMIQKKQSQVVFVLTGDCDDPHHEGYIAYEQIASTSSGQVFLLKKSQVNQVINFVRVAVQSRKVNLMAVDVLDATSNVFSIPVDTKLQEITISVSGRKPKIVLTDPSGNRFTKRNGLNELLKIKNALIVNVKDPKLGVWKMQVESQGRHTIRVTGLSTTDFVAGFSRKPVNDIKDTDHRPIEGIPTYMLINTTDVGPPADFSQLQLVDLFGTSIAEYPLIKDPYKDNIYTVPSFVPPQTFFYVKISGVDDSGYRIERQTPTAITQIVPDPPEVRMPNVTKGYFGLTAVIVCEVQSLIPYTVHWFKEDTQQGPELYFLESANVTLDVPGANQFAEGIYFCNATNKKGSRRVPTFLDISEPPPSIVTPQNVSVLPNQNAIITCNVFSAVDFNLTWHRHGYRHGLRTSQKFHDFKNGSLLVRRVQLEDEGFYVCRAANEGGVSEKAVFIRVQVAPVAEVIPEKTSFAVGDSKEVQCRAEGFPEPSINWLRGKQVMIANERIRLSGGKLSLYNMHRGDEGQYTCLASNSAGNHTVIATFNYIEKPRITMFESKVLVASGDEAVLFCAANGIPAPEIRWYKGDIQLKALAYVQISASGELKLIGAQQQDAGEYKCEAVNEAGSDSASIVLEVGSAPKIVDAPENTGQDIGGNATLTCRASGSPVPKVFWKRQDGRKLDSRVKQLPTGDLFIQNLGIKDEGSYVCVAQNQFGIVQRSAHLTITGIVPPLIGYMDPIIQAINGDSVEFNCQVLLGNPTPRVLWLVDGQAVREDEYIRRNGDGNIYIDDVQAYHSGDYLCLASNVGGNASFMVTLQVQVPPTFDYFSPEDEKIDFNVTQGDTVVLPCNVLGDPRPSITWYKDESPISLTDYHYYIREDGSLEIFSTEATDTALYRCQATNVAGEIEKVVNLFVQVAPTIAGEPNERFTVIENETAVLPCVASGVPPPDVSWRKNFVPFSPESERILFGDYGLTILDAKIEDKAIYECVASNMAGEATKVITLVVQIPPVILDKGDTDITIIKGEKVSFHCENSGNPIPTVDWKKDETVLSVFDEVNGFEEFDNGSLKIESARIDHTGRYVCVVENDAGIATRDFFLTVLDPPSIPANLTTFKDILEGNPLILQCPAVGTPTPLITWYKDDVLITGDQVGMVILEDGSLEILETEAEDSSVYTCIAQNQAGVVQHEVEVKVIVPPKLTGKDEGQDGVVDNPNVIVGENVTLICPVEADPYPTITWLRNGYELDLSELDTRFEISADGMNLTIYEADVSDTARYTCIAKNVGGEAEKNFDLDVHVPPTIDKDSVSPEENTVVKDNSLYLNCPVTGIPTPKVFWYKDGEILDPDLDPNIHVHAKGLRLEIVGARVSDTGMYKCVGENVAGSTEQSFDVDVQVGPVIDRPGEINKPEIVSNESISLTCPASGIPLPEVTWFKNNQPISSNTSQYTLLNDGWTLRIISANVSDSARYICRAQNPAGQGEKAFDLDVLVPPNIDRNNLIVDPKVVLNKSVIINCLVEGKPSPSIIWYKNGIQLDASVQPRYEILSSGRQLRVKMAQPSDTATFQCLAENKAGSDTVDFHLKVLVPAKIENRRPNTNPKVVVNGNITVVCRATGTPKPTISWYKDGVELDSLENVEINNDGQELTIYSAQVADTALYTCRAVNEAGESDISYQVDVQVPPKLDEDEVNASPHVELGNSVVLNCPVVGVPQPNIVWMKAGQPIDYDSHRHITVQADGQRLSIERARLTDADVYTCIAANQAGSVEQDYELDVWVPPSIDGTNLDLNPTVIKGHTSELFCPVEGNPFPDILWLKDGEPVQLDSRVEIIDDGIQLKILNATESDTGRYECVARNPAGQQSLAHNLEVHVKPSIDESNVVYFRKVIENRTIIIECPVSGIPTPTVDWLINGNRVRSREGLQFSHNNNHLEIARAQVTDTAVYTCIATNAAGELKKNFDLEVQVPPKIDTDKLATELSVTQNKSTAIVCPVSGIPEPSVIWYKDDEPLLDWPYQGLSLKNREKTLEVLNAQTDDAGVYRCEATNRAGQLKLDFTLHVYVPPQISGSEAVTHVSVTHGANVALECVASGNPEPQLAWIKDDETIELVENPHIVIQNKGRLLQISNSEVTDSGRYVCHAENRVGIAERKFELDINVPPYINGSLEGLQNVWVIINKPLTLECPAEGVPPPSITWRRQGQFIQQYGRPGLRLQDNGRKLYIVRAQLRDLGDYSCYVENVAGNASLDYFVNVYVPPTIERGLERVEAVVNTGATLLCETLGLPDPVVTWQKDGEPFPTTGLRHRMRVSGTIEFTSVRLEDTGTYSCNATNEAGSATRVMKLDVQVPPRMVGTQPLYLNVAEGRGIVLPCNVTGTPVPTITWQKGAKMVTGGQGIAVIENGSLYIQKTAETDAGVYLCIAENNAGAAFGQIILRINLPPTIHATEKDLEFVINKGQKIVLPCIASGRPRPKVTWEKDGVPIIRSNAYVRLTRSGLAVTFAREGDVGTYTCIARNVAGTSRVDMKLLVQEPPTIDEESRLLTSTVGETADLRCAATGIPPPTIRWLKDGREIEEPSSKYEITRSGNLLVKQLTEDDTGSYLCTATNVAGQATQERLLRIQVPPSFIVVPQIKEVLLEQRLELRCTAKGRPTPTIHWKRNDVPVAYVPSVNGRSVLIFHNVRREDAGVYTCLAQNPAGQAVVNTMVTVKVPPEILTPPGNKAVTIAERVVLTCSVGGDPPPEVIWMKNGRPVRLSSRIQQLSNGSLVIFDSTSSDAGKYKCVATNDAGMSEGVAMLTVREPPSFLIEPQHTRVNQDETVLVDCVGSGEPEPKMDWMMGWDILQDEGRLSVLPNNSLRIVAAQLSDSGSYRCLASNNLGKTFIEINITVVVHGGWSEWSDWKLCSASCGEGRQLRHRLCDNPEPANQGEDCKGKHVQSRSCQLRNCPVSGNWGNWLPWEQCSVSCNEGVQLRRRLCDNPAPQSGGGTCVGDAVEEQTCNRRPCAVDGNWGEWSSWQACSVTCGDGYQERRRKCNNPPPSGNGRFCQGEQRDTQRCKLRECPVDGNWGNWGHWNPCTLSCGGGTRTRSRMCNYPEPKYGGLFCIGTDIQLDYCNSEPCPVHGGWSEWGEFGECSVSCNGGLKKRFRTCSNPPPGNNGRPCRGQTDDTLACNQEPCPVDGQWSNWSEWSVCSRTCDHGTKYRERTCQLPKHGGILCRGDNKQIMDCFQEPCYDIPIIAEGNLIGYINNIDIPAATFSVDMVPLPDNTATSINATIRGVPTVLVPHFRHLLSVLSPVYWSTAQEIDGAYNGYTLTDGEFTREAQIQYTTGEILKMSHYSKGVDHDGKLQLDIVLRGNVPDIAETQIVKITPYWEQYTQSGPGSVHAQSTQLMHVDEFMLPYASNHSIVYSKENKMPFLVQRMYANNLHVDVFPDREIINYILETSIAPGSPSNQCPDGFILNVDGAYCQDDDECTRLRPCSDYCHNSPGSYYCSCPLGYVLDVDGRQCTDIDECSTASANCPADQECTNTIGSYFCHVRCGRGYRPFENGQKCIDIDECTESPGVCDQICVNKNGGYRCRCMPGYRRISRSKCVDIDECELTNSPCEQVCANAIGSYLCSCRQGYQLVSRGRCKDINECKTSNINCGAGQRCVNSVGSYRCVTVCPQGSELINGNCKDIDECQTGKHRCYYNQQCVNTEPGYRCVCPRGYRSAGPGTPCLDINECEDDPGICQHNCTNTVGSYKCTCPPGYRVSKDQSTCQDINECIENYIKCGRDRMCFNTLGEFTCIDIPCPRGYQRDPITNNCVLECIDAEVACPENARYADVIEFRTLALPSGVLAEQRLIKLTAYNQNNEILRNTVFNILENDETVAFYIQLEDGVGIVFTQQPLEDSHLYRIKVQAKSFDNTQINIQYQTTFLIHIAVSAYPY